MPRPNKNWERKYGKKQEQHRSLLSGLDTVLSATEKLAKGNSEAESIILRALSLDAQPFMRLLDLDDMGLVGDRIVQVYKGYAKSDLNRFIKGVRDREIK